MKRIVVPSLVVLAVFAAVPAAFAADDCTATATATLDHEEDAELQFQVEVSTEAACADIDYDLILEIQLADGETTKLRKSRVVKLDDGSLTEMVRHKLAVGQSLVGQETQVMRCKECQLEP